jgi:transcriptional regulator with XRE-family HTH domain
MSPRHTKSVPRILRESRERAGLSQEQLAEEIGCHQTAISGWEAEGERNRGSAAFLRAMRLAAALELRPADFR